MKVIARLLVLSALASCGDKDDDDKTTSSVPAGSKLAVADLAAPSGITALDEADVKSSVEGFDFSATDSTAAASSADTDTSKCGAILENAAKGSVTGSVITVSATLDLLACTKADAAAETPPSPLVFNKATINLYLTFECTGKDVSAYNGKSTGEFNADTICTNGYKIFSNARSESSFTTEGKTVESVSIQATSTAANEPCTVTVANGVSTRNGCVTISKSISTGGFASVEFQKTVDKNVTWKASTAETFYTSGSMDVIFGNWTGAVTFTGATTQPTYTLTDSTTTTTGSVRAISTGLTQRMLRLARLAR